MMEPAKFRLYNWMNEAWNDKLIDQSLILNKYASRDTYVTLPGELNQMMSIQKFSANTPKIVHWQNTRV